MCVKSEEHTLKQMELQSTDMIRPSSYVNAKNDFHKIIKKKHNKYAE